MSIKLTLLRSGESLIAETKELISQEDQLVPHSYLVENPHIVQVQQNNILEENNSFTQDCQIKRGQFIGRIHSLNQEFSYATSAVKTKLYDIFTLAFFTNSSR